MHIYNIHIYSKEFLNVVGLIDLKRNYDSSFPKFLSLSIIHFIPHHDSIFPVKSVFFDPFAPSLNDFITTFKNQNTDKTKLRIDNLNYQMLF